MKNMNKHIILPTILFQAIVILMFSTSIIRASSIETLKQNIPFFNAVIIVTTILIVISLQKLQEYEEKQAELKLVKTNMEAVEGLLTLLRAERHDYVSHIQVVQALNYMKQYRELSEYIESIATEYRQTNEIIRVGDPALTALLNSKREVAQKKGINFYITCKHQINSTQLSPWELGSLFSNLIENAIEAALISEGEKFVKVVIDYNHDGHVIQIENTGQISREIAGSLFKPGHSTKDSGTRGYGLHICEKILSKYNSTIDFKNTERGTVVCKIRLPEVTSIHDSKAI